MAMKFSLKLAIVAITLIATIVIGAYAITALFTQRIPTATIKPPPSSSSAIGNCSTLTISPDTVTLSASSSTQGIMNVTCGGNGSAFTVMSEGLFTATLGGGVCSPSGICNLCSWGCGGFTVLNYTTWQSQGCGQPYQYSYPRGYTIPYTNLGSSGGFITLSAGDYVYCLGYNLQPYTVNSPTSLPSFTITWNSS